MHWVRVVYHAAGFAVRRSRARTHFLPFLNWRNKIQDASPGASVGSRGPHQRGPKPGFGGLWWALVGFCGLWWALSGFIGFWWALSGLIGFDRVLSGFIRFCAAIVLFCDEFHTGG